VATVSRITDISSVSELNFDDAIRAGLERAKETLRGLQSAVITQQEVLIGPHGEPDGYKVTMSVTFVLDGQIITDLAPYPDAATQLADFASVEERSAR
jgi:flavin-binding protein dodecin